MPKTKSQQPAEFRVAERLSPAAELATFERTVEFLRTNPGALHDTMRRAGIVTARGKLTKAFGG